MLDALTDHPHGIGFQGQPARPGSEVRGSLDLGLVDCGRHSAPWFVVRFNGGDQHLVRPALHRLGVSTFLPLIRQTVPDRRLGKRTVTVPAFPGCLFAQWPAAFVWQRILAEPGVLSGPSGIIRPVGDPYGQPQAVPAWCMAELFERATDGGVIRDDTVPPAKAPKRRWTALADLAGPERLDLLHQAMGQRTARHRDVEPA